jgi:biotin carboxylase
MKTILFIGYRGKSRAIQAAKDLGYQVVLLKQNQNNLPINGVDFVYQADFYNAKDLQETIRKIRDLHSPVQVITNYEEQVVIRSIAAEICEVPGSSVKSALATRHKIVQRKKLAGLNSNLDFRVISTFEEAQQAFEELGRDVFLKFATGFKSKFVFHIKLEEELKKAWQNINAQISKLPKHLLADYQGFEFNSEYPDPQKFFLMEKRAKGQQIALASIIGEDLVHHFPSALDLYPASCYGIDDAFVAIRILPSQLPADKIAELKKIADEIYKRLELKNCASHSEFCHDEDGFKLIESSSRMGGYRDEMYELAYQLNIHGDFIKLITGEKPNESDENHHYVAMCEFYPNREMELVQDKFTKLDFENILDFKINYQFGEICGPARDGFKPLFLYKVLGKDYQSVKETAEKTLSELRRKFD